MYQPSPKVVDPESQPLLPFYSDRFQLADMRESLGFRISIIATIIYIIGFAFSIAVDIKPRKEILLRLMKDLRNIDRYGLREGGDSPEYLEV